MTNFFWETLKNTIKNKIVKVVVFAFKKVFLLLLKKFNFFFVITLDYGVNLWKISESKHCTWEAEEASINVLKKLQRNMISKAEFLTRNVLFFNFHKNYL